MLITSLREGWGLTATEANAFGCIPIAYKVPGIIDSIKNGVNGILVEEKDPRTLANEAIKILANSQKRRRIGQAGINFSKKLSWENCYQDLRVLL